MNGSVLALDYAETADREEFRRAVLAGLSRTPRAIPPKFLYDARGSALFDAICDLPEYYLTRTEIEILKRHAAEKCSKGPSSSRMSIASPGRFSFSVVNDWRMPRRPAASVARFWSPSSSTRAAWHHGRNRGYESMSSTSAYILEAECSTIADRRISFMN